MPSQSLEEYTDSQINDMYNSGQLENIWPSYMGQLTVTPMLSGLSARADLGYTYTSTNQAGQVTVDYRDGDATLSTSTSPEKKTGGASYVMYSGLFDVSATITLANEPCIGKSAHASGWGEVWNEVALIGFVLPRLSVKFKSGGNVYPSTQECPPPDDCTSAGEGTATLRAGFVIASLCGTNTGSPGGGCGDPSGDPGQHCYWARDFIIYADGSWSWLTAWYKECDEYAQLRMSNSAWPSLRSGSSFLATVSPAPLTAPLRLRLLGTGSLENGRAIEVRRHPGLDVDAVVRIDLTRATPADLEAAFSTSRKLRQYTDDVGAIQGSPSATILERSGPSSRAAGFLRSLANAAEVQTTRFGRARSLDVTVADAPR
jgi:hypothetical protein